MTSTACLTTIAILLGGLASVPAHAELPIKTVIEGKFRALTETCFGKNSFTEAFVPKNLSTHPTGEATDYLHVGGVSFLGLASYAYSSVPQLASARTGSVADYIPLPATSEAVIGHSSFNQLTYNVSCTSALKTAVDAGINPAPVMSFAPLNIRAGLTAEASNAANSGLLVLYGRFESPLSRLVNDRRDSARRMRGFATLWSYLSQTLDPARAYLDYLEGWLITSTTAKNAQAALEVSANADVHALVLDADWTGKSGISFKSDFSNQLFDVFVVPKPNAPGEYNFAFYRMPTAAEMSAEVQNVATINPGKAEIVSGQPGEFVVTIPELDAYLCGVPNDWSVSTPPPNTVLTVTPVMKDRTCSLAITVNVVPSPVSRQLPINIQNNRRKIGGGAVSVLVSTQYRTAAAPVVHLSEVPKLLISGDRPAKLVVDAPVAWEVIPGTTVSNVRVTAGTLACGNLPVEQSMVYGYSSGSSAPSIHTEFGFIDKSHIPSGRCTWSAYMDFVDGPVQVQGKEIAYVLELNPSTVANAP